MNERKNSYTALLLLVMFLHYIQHGSMYCMLHIFIYHFRNEREQEKNNGEHISRSFSLFLALFYEV